LRDMGPITVLLLARDPKRSEPGDKDALCATVKN
jgi:hypothetical protein